MFTYLSLCRRSLSVFCRHPSDSDGTRASKKYLFELIECRVMEIALEMVYGSLCLNNSHRFLITSNKLL